MHFTSLYATLCLLLLLWQVEAYLFDGYWEDMRSIGAFYHANMECIKISNMGYKLVTELPERAESTMQVNHVSEFYKLYIMAPRQLTQTSLPWQLLRYRLSSLHHASVSASNSDWRSCNKR